MKVRSSTWLGRVAVAAQPGRPLLHVRVPPWLAQVLVAAGAQRVVTVDSMAVRFDEDAPEGSPATTRSAAPAAAGADPSPEARTARRTQRAIRSGVQTTGPGAITITGSALGPGTEVRNTSQPGRSAKPVSTSPISEWDVGVITILPGETHAIVDSLGAAGTLRQRVHDGGLRVYESLVNTEGRTIKVGVTQASGQGQIAAAIASSQLRERYNPSIVALVGTAGGISPAVRPGDVVVAQDIIYYDLRKETSAGTALRGRDQPVPAPIRRAINAFFTDHGEPYQATITNPDGTQSVCHVLRGSIDSGNAIIADRHPPSRRHMLTNKVLAVQTEAAGIAEAFLARTDTQPQGWIVICGISDHAGAAKDDTRHEIPARHAAAILLQMLPYLVPGSTTAS